MANKIDEKKILEVAAKHRLNPRQIAFVREYVKDPKRSKKDLMLAAGYSPASTDSGSNNPARKMSVRNALVDYLKSPGISGKLQGFYERALNRDETELQDAKFKLEVAKELHKIRGDYAPAKSQSVKISGSIADMFGGSNKDCNSDASIIEGEIEEEEDG